MYVHTYMIHTYIQTYIHTYIHIYTIQCCRQPDGSDRKVKNNVFIFNHS